MMLQKLVFYACSVIKEKKYRTTAHRPAAGNTGCSESPHSSSRTDNDIPTTAVAADEGNCYNEESEIDFKTVVSRRKW